MASPKYKNVVHIGLTIPKKLRERMRKVTDVNWSRVASEAFEQVVLNYERGFEPQPTRELLQVMQEFESVDRAIDLIEKRLTRNEKRLDKLETNERKRAEHGGRKPH